MIPRRGFLPICASAAVGCHRSSRRVVGVVPKATSHLFFVSVHSGVRTAAQEYDLDIICNGPNDETDHNRQIQIVDSTQ